jgi:hypothetical protein
MGYDAVVMEVDQQQTKVGQTPLLQLRNAQLRPVQDKRDVYRLTAEVANVGFDSSYDVHMRAVQLQGESHFGCAQALRELPAGHTVRESLLPQVAQGQDAVRHPTPVAAFLRPGESSIVQVDLYMPYLLPPGEHISGTADVRMPVHLQIDVYADGGRSTQSVAVPAGSINMESGVDVSRCADIVQQPQLSRSLAGV